MTSMKLQKPPISILMSVCNGEAHLQNALKSILCQTFSNFEFIIIDDASRDNSPCILESYKRKDHRIRIIQNDQNLGLTKSLNNGLENATGVFIARQDADDLSLPDRLEKQYQYFLRHPDLCLVSSSACIIDAHGKEIFPSHYRLNQAQIMNHMKRHNIITHGSVMFRRKEILDLGGYREHFQYAQDYDLWLRIIEKYKIHIIPEYLYKVRISFENISMKKCIYQKEFADIAKKMHRQRKKTGKDHYDRFFKTFNPASLANSGKKGYARYHYLKAMYLLGEDKLGLMRKELFHSLKYFPLDPNVYFYLFISVFGLKIISVLRKVRDYIYKY